MPEIFCSFGEYDVIISSSNKILKLSFRKTKLVIQSLSYVGQNTWNSLPDNLKSDTLVNLFKHYIKVNLLKKLGNVEADIYSYTWVDTKTKFVAFSEFMQNRVSIVFTFFFVSISRFFPMFSIFSLGGF